MASLNLSINGPSIKSSYQSVVNASLPASSSPTFAHWAVFSVQAPLQNAFQDTGGKESVLKVHGVGDGELSELAEEFSEGRIQFAFAKVKDSNSGLPKCLLIAWCGGGVPERTKGYFTSHLAAAAKVLHGYHVQITARSDSDLDPSNIIQKVADASGAKYSAASSSSSRPSAPAPPPVASKPVFTPTSSSSGRQMNPIVAARSQRGANLDDDGWGADAPPVTRTQIERVESAYKPTKVDMAALTKTRQDPVPLPAMARQHDGDGHADVVKGGYQPVGKVDIAAIRAQASRSQDDRPTPVKGAYEPIGKVDIAAIRAKAQPQKPLAGSSEPPAVETPGDRQPWGSEQERLTTLPKPRVANKFGSASFTGTKAPTPGALGFSKPAAPAPPVGAASRTFADQGGKTPAQLWAEKKAKEQGSGVPSTASPPIGAQKSGGEWRSGYKGKSWAPVQTGTYGRSISSDLHSEATGESAEEGRADEPASPGGGVSALRDRFKDAQPMSATPHSHFAQEEAHARSPAPSGGFALPGLPTRPSPPTDDDDGMDAANIQAEEARDPSPVRIAVPTARLQDMSLKPAEERDLPPPVPPTAIEERLPKEDELPAEEETYESARGASTAMAHEAAASATGAAPSEGSRAVVQFDYERAEDNEVDLVAGDYVHDIDQVDPDWWLGTNSRGDRGLFPSNYVELVEDEAPGETSMEPPAPTGADRAAPPPPAAEPASAGPTATALFDYEAAEDNELSFPDGAKITKLEFPDEDWWFGHFSGQSGLFPANYVQLDS